MAWNCAIHEMYHTCSFIFTIGVLLIQPKFVASHCSYQINEAIQKCVQPIALYAKVLNQEDEQNSSNTAKNSFGQAITLPKIGRYVFRELCRLVRNFNECVHKWYQQCPEHITVNLIDASYGFLCNEGYETFMQSAECLVELDRQPKVKQCHEITLKYIENANEQLNSVTSNRFDKMCQALNYFASCVERPIAYGCGAEAWTMIFRVLRDTTNTLLPKCSFTGRSILAGPLGPATTTTATITTSEMLNDKAKIIWSNDDDDDDDVTTNSNSVLSNVDEELGAKYGHDNGPRRSSIKSQDEELSGTVTQHVFIDSDTDISYYDSSNDNFVESIGSSSFLAVNSANHSHLIIIILLQYLSFSWIILKLC